MEQVLEVFKKIEAESSTTGKKKLLVEYQHTPHLQRVVQLALTPGVSYGLTDLAPGFFGNKDPEEVFSWLEEKSKRRGASQDDQIALSSMVHGAGREIVTRIIRRDLRIGMANALMNEAIPGLVPQIPYQRFRSFKHLEKMDLTNGIAQLKYDGMFSYFFTQSKDFLTRNGSRFTLGDAKVQDIGGTWVKALAVGLMEAPLVMMGELLVRKEDGTWMPRKEGNGIINSFISGDGDRAYVDKIFYVTWGFITEEEFNQGYSDMRYANMFETMKCAVNAEGMRRWDNIILSESEPVRSIEEAMAFYRRKRKRKEEGAMVKDAVNLRWRNDKSGTIFGCKLKPEVIAEFRIVDAYHGKKGKKNEHLLGGLVIRTEDSKIITKVGMGFSDKDRELGVDYWKGKIDDIISVAFTGITTDKSDRATYCLEHARMVETRFHEKTVADTYEYCVEELAKA